MRVGFWLLVIAALLTGCSGAQEAPAPAPSADRPIDRLISTTAAGGFDSEALQAVAKSGDVRLAWLISDLLRFTPPGAQEDELVDAFVELTGIDPRDDPSFSDSAWLAVTDRLIASDPPAPPGIASSSPSCSWRSSPPGRRSSPTANPRSTGAWSPGEGC